MDIMTVFSGPYAILARVVVWVVLISSLIGYGFFKGNEHGTQKLINYVGEQATASVKLVAKQTAVTEKIVTEYVKVAGKTKIVHDTIQTEVTKYVDSKPLALSCMLDERWVRLHDSAAAGTVPPPAGAADGASGGISAAEALPTITENYGAAIRNKNKLTGLQSWVREQEKVK